jgi:hypothetical protein
MSISIESFSDAEGNDRWDAPAVYLEARACSNERGCQYPETNEC